MLFGSSGIRMQYGQTLIDLALRVGGAVGSGRRRVIVGSDTRSTRYLLSESLTAGLLSAGADVISGGIAPTPTVAYAARTADAGCMVTASHNPEEYNGLKLFNPDGSSFTLEQQRKIEELQEIPVWSDWEAIGARTSGDIVTPHREAILSSLSPSEDLRVVLDCGGGAGSVITPDLLKEAGMSVVTLNCDPTKTFPRPSEPLPENLSYIPSIIRASGAACGIAHDGDADRCVAFDNLGRFIAGEHLLMLFARYLDLNEVVTTVDASMAIEEVATVRRTPVGDSYVSEALLSWGSLGGEPSGSWIFPSHSLCPDGIYAAALICEIAGEWNIAEEIDRMPRYPILRSAIPTPHGHAALSALGAEIPTDGLRVADEDGWYLIRASGTEPKVRITAEGRTEQVAKALLTKGEDRLKAAIRGVL
ncbi:MAG: phosphopentomutase/phosphoglucosamine mutase [Methanocalculus sp.]|uniref:phosphopentomutase/phosphoglucosamine mutase n=1 Tax=Methanocalculus sp. TaxID=2004547 RepID=UPI0027248C6E|nr:phosphopentomutase/phosphoglucosamine mutase [Methanocalculus sp.]MDO8841798.1 phosphopentomutase/phosphoglucosamine mutase [Methanocalculus sp.]MDO9539653.1 phosphopentomutase/phosphoglucosamine mutase [Methanocalculus sp.]